VHWGTVAVDPSVIPLGSRLLIDGYDMVFVAEDTGGGIRGNHVDIFFPDYASAVRFGVQTRMVTVLNS
jgi:3D (Asp-Asp-Asp) domain-containing protein